MRRLFVVFLVCHVAPSAQQAPPPQPGQAATFRSSTLLIVQTVMVKDGKGKPIEGLTAGDFIVAEDGVRQDIAFVEYQKLEAPPIGTTDLTPAVPAAAASAVSPVTAVSETTPAVPLPGDARFRGKRLIVFYLDLSSMSFFNQFRVFDGVRTYLETQMTTVDLLSIAVFQHSRLRLRLDFTDDREALRRVVGEIEREQLDAEQGGAISYDPGGPFGENDATFNMFSMDRKLAALQTTVTNLGALPELKTLIYFGGGLQIGSNNLAQLRATVNAAVRANVTINPIDTSGLRASAPMGNATRPSPGGAGMFSGALAMGSIRRQQTEEDTYYALAKDTGGKATVNLNDLSLGITQAAQAVPGYYMLGYYTKNLQKDGKFRRVKVSLSGPLADTAELSHRPGYYGAKEWSKFNAFDKERQLEEALRLEDPITDIPIAVEINYFQVSSAEYFVPISVRMPGSELIRARPTGDTKAVIDMIGEIKTEHGATVRNARDKLEFTLDAASATETARRPIQYETGFTLLPGAYMVKVLARDATTGRIGTFLQKFVVPNLEREFERLPISTVVLSSQRVAPGTALYSVQQRIPATMANPLIHDGLKLVPSVTRTFKVNQPLFIYLQAYERDASAIRPLVAFAAFYRDGLKVFETQAIGFDTWDEQYKAVSIRLSVSPGQLEPGTYECQVAVLDPSGNRAAFWRAPVVMLR